MKITKRQLRRIIKEAVRSQGVTDWGPRPDVTDWVVTIEFNDGTSEEHVVQASEEQSAELIGLYRLDSKESKKSVFQVADVSAIDTGTLRPRRWGCE